MRSLPLASFKMPRHPRHPATSHDTHRHPAAHPTPPNRHPTAACLQLSGDQSICLTNSHSSDTRPIGFAFREEAQELLTGADLAGMAATEENVGEMVTVANDLTQGLDMLRDHQEYMRMREEQHRATVAKTNSKVPCVNVCVDVPRTHARALYSKRWMTSRSLPN